MRPPDLEVLLPVHNEAASIEGTLVEIYQTVSAVASMRFLLCEDGNTDGTPDVLRRLTGVLPIRLLTDPQRKGYARAVIDGLRNAEAPFVLCMDADGQVDPVAIVRAWPLRDEFDVVVGWRVRRADAFPRRVMSRVYRMLHAITLQVPLRDPSCPFILVGRRALSSILDELGVLREGLWWEFTARVWHGGFGVAEVAVQHRPRAAGLTQVYRWHKIPGIAWSHLAGLWVLRRQLAHKRRGSVRVRLGSAPRV